MPGVCALYKPLLGPDNPDPITKRERESIKRKVWKKLHSPIVSKLFQISN